jgi:hypothetical protein
MNRLEKTRKPFKVWFWAVFEISSRRNGISAKELQRIMGFGSYKTAWSWLHKLRAALVRPGREPSSALLRRSTRRSSGERAHPTRSWFWWPPRLRPARQPATRKTAYLRYHSPATRYGEELSPVHFIETGACPSNLFSLIINCRRRHSGGKEIDPIRKRLVLEGLGKSARLLRLSPPRAKGKRGFPVSAAGPTTVPPDARRDSCSCRGLPSAAPEASERSRPRAWCPHPGAR